MKNQLSVPTNFFIENMPFNIGISLFHFQLKSIIDARRLYLQWFPLQHPGTEVQFPLKEMDIKAFSVCLCRAGFTFSRIINNIYLYINNSYQSTRSVKNTLQQMQLQTCGTFVIFSSRQMVLPPFILEKVEQASFPRTERWTDGLH